MPLVRIHWIVIDAVGRAKGQPAVCAAREHDVAAVGRAELLHGSNHVNVVVSSRSRTVDCQENLSCESPRIDRCAKQQAATEIDRRGLVKSRCNSRILRVAGANAEKRAAEVAAADEQIAIRIHVECSPNGRIGNEDRTHPSYSTICRPTKLSPSPVVATNAPSLILEAVTHAPSFIDGEPLLVSSAHVTETQARPGFPTC